MGTGWGDLRVGPCGTLTQRVPSLAGEVGCVRGQALPCMEGHSIEQEDFLKKKKTLRGTLGNSTAATAPVSSPPSHPPIQGACAPTRECLHLISEGAETTGTRESANQRRLYMHTHSPEKAYHKKKEWVEAGNTRIPPGRGNPPTKETPTDKNRRR